MATNVASKYTAPRIDSIQLILVISDILKVKGTWLSESGPSLIFGSSEAQPSNTSIYNHDYVVAVPEGLEDNTALLMKIK